jgi:hypothetical protein
MSDNTALIAAAARGNSSSLAQLLTNLNQQLAAISHLLDAAGQPVPPAPDDAFGLEFVPPCPALPPVVGRPSLVELAARIDALEFAAVTHGLVEPYAPPAPDAVEPPVPAADPAPAASTDQPTEVQA